MSNHVDVDQLLEDYAWSHFKDLQSLRKTRLEDFRSLEKDDCEFTVVGCCHESLSPIDVCSV